MKMVSMGNRKFVKYEFEIEMIRVVFLAHPPLSSQRDTIQICWAPGHTFAKQG